MASLVGAAEEAVGDIGDVAGGGAAAVAEVVLVDGARVVLAQRLVDAVGGVGVAKVLQVLLEVVGAGAHHRGDLVLGETVLAGEAGAAVALHQAGSGVAVVVVGGLDTDVAGALLHDDGEDDALLDTELGTLDDGVPDAADVLAGVTSLLHGGLVGVEDILERLPLVHGREAGGRAGVVSETHCD